MDLFCRRPGNFCQLEYEMHLSEAVSGDTWKVFCTLRHTIDVLLQPHTISWIHLSFFFSCCCRSVFHRRLLHVDSWLIYMKHTYSWRLTLMALFTADHCSSPRTAVDNEDNSEHIAGESGDSQSATGWTAKGAQFNASSTCRKQWRASSTVSFRDACKQSGIQCCTYITCDRSWKAVTKVLINNTVSITIIFKIMIITLQLPLSTLKCKSAVSYLSGTYF